MFKRSCKQEFSRRVAIRLKIKAGHTLLVMMNQMMAAFCASCGWLFEGPLFHMKES